MKTTISTLFILLLFGLASCVTPVTPKTPRETLVAVEFSYQAALSTAESMVDLGQIRGDSARQLSSLISAGRVSLDAADNAVRVGSGDAISLVNAANVAVTNLILYLQQQKGKANERLGSARSPVCTPDPRWAECGRGA